MTPLATRVAKRVRPVKQKQQAPTGKTLVVLGAGQSNMEYWSRDGWGAAGDSSFTQQLSELNPNGKNIFIQGAFEGSYLSKKAYDIAVVRLGSYDANWWWVDDRTGTLSAGPRLTACIARLTASGINLKEVTHLMWSQGEADASEIYSTQAGNVPGYSYTDTEYYTALVWLKDYFFSVLPNLEKFHIRPIGRRVDTNSRAHGAVRTKEQALAAAYPNQVVYGSEVYDLSTDGGVHRNASGFSREARRVAKEIAASKGLYTGNTVGAYVSAASYNASDPSITLTITHDAGTSLKSASGEVYSGTPINCTPSAGIGMFSVYDPAGRSRSISSVYITDYDKIKITLTTPLIGTSYVRYGYNNMYGIDLSSIVYDNHGDNPLPLRTLSGSAISTGITADAYFDSIGATVWFDSQYTANISKDASDIVTSVTSRKNALVFSEATTANKPKYIASAINSKPAIRGFHNGVASRLTLSDTPYLDWTEVTLILIARRHTDENATSHIVSKYGSSPQSEWAILVEQLQVSGADVTTDRIYPQFTTNGSTGVSTKPTYVPTLGNPFIHIARVQGTTLKALTSGLAIDYATGTLLNSTNSTTLSSIFNGTSALSLFCRPGGTTLPSKVDIGEFLFVPIHLSDEQVYTTMAAAYMKWS